MRKPILFYLFPREAYYVPSAGRVTQLLDAMDRTLELGLKTGGTFWGSLRENPPEPDKPGDPPPGEGQAFEADSFDEFCERAEKLNGLEAIHVNLGRPGREPLADIGVGTAKTAKTQRIEVRGYKRLRMVGLNGLEGARQVCPPCGEEHPLESSPPAHPDPRYYCTVCGGLTPLPETQLLLGGTPSPSVPIAFPCYRFALHFHAAADPDEQDGPKGPVAGVPRVAVISSHRFPDVEILEAAVGCGLRAMLVRASC